MATSGDFLMAADKPRVLRPERIDLALEVVA